MVGEPVNLPAKIDTLSALRLLSLISKAAETRNVVLNFARQPVLEPFGMLLLSCLGRTLRASGVKFQLQNVDKYSYAAHIGFLEQFDESYCSIGNGARGNDRYIVIRAITRAELNAEAIAANIAYMGDAIDKFATRLAKLLTQSDEGGVLVNALTHCLREIIRNSYEHSGSDEILVCAQYRQTANRVDLAFADSGVGVLRTLRRNRGVSVESHTDALKVALMPGISGTLTTRWDDSNPWANSGYGLFMTHRICREGGVFSICSGDSLLSISGGQFIERQMPEVGTVVGISVVLDQLMKLNKSGLNDLAAEGSEIRKALKGKIVTPKMAATILSNGQENK